MPKKGTATRNSRTRGSAAAFCGVIGLPDPGRGPDLHDAGLVAFCRQFNERAEHFLEYASPESRSFVRAERQLAAVLR